MKKLLIGLTLLTSTSAFANTNTGKNYPLKHRIDISCYIVKELFTIWAPINNKKIEEQQYLLDNNKEFKIINLGFKISLDESQNYKGLLTKCKKETIDSGVEFLGDLSVAANNMLPDLLIASKSDKPLIQDILKRRDLVLMNLYQPGETVIEN